LKKHGGRRERRGMMEETDQLRNRRRRRVVAERDPMRGRHRHLEQEASMPLERKQHKTTQE